MKVEEKLFKEQATLLRKYGAATVVMAFDEEGQAATEDEEPAAYGIDFIKAMKRIKEM